MAFGSPPFTPFPIQNGQGQTFQVYVTPSMLSSYGVQQAALDRVANDVQVSSCVAASVRADSYIGDKYPLPLLAFDVDLVLPVAHIAIWLCLSNVGRNPSAGYDDQIDKRYEEAVAYMGQIARGAFRLNVLVNQPPAPFYQLPAVRTHRRRGW